MQLKGRLKVIYDRIPLCGILADIGTDHAHIPAAALINGLCKKALACDVRKGPLKRALDTKQRYGLGDELELRLGSGLEPLKEEECDVIILAGMGGNLIGELLTQQRHKAQRARRIILQPMHAQESVRPYLWENGFEVEEEVLAQEGDKLYQVLAVRYNESERRESPLAPEQAWKAVIGEKLITERDPLLKLWIENRKTRQQRIVDGMAKALAPRSQYEREAALLGQLEELLKQIQG